MTKEEEAVVAAYTATTMCDFYDTREHVESIIGGRLFTYWAAFDAIQDEIRRVSTKEEKRRSKGKK